MTVERAVQKLLQRVALSRQARIEAEKLAQQHNPNAAFAGGNLCPMHGIREEHELRSAEMTDGHNEAGARDLLVQGPTLGFEEDRGAVFREAEGDARQRRGQHRYRTTRITEMVVKVDHAARAQMLGQHC